MSLTPGTRLGPARSSRRSARAASAMCISRARCAARAR